jgi:transcriptional regulator with XRE-family HTH domain
METLKNQPFSSQMKKRKMPDIVCAGNNDFGLTLREIRLERNISQQDAAALLGVTQSQWSAYEIGKSNVTIDTMLAMAKIFKISPFELLGRAMDKSKYFDSHIDLSSKDFEEIAKNTMEEYKKKQIAKKLETSS